MRRRSLSIFLLVPLPLVAYVACSGNADHGPPAVGCNEDPSCATGTSVTGHDAADAATEADASLEASPDAPRPDATLDGTDGDEPVVLPTRCDDPTVTGNLAIIDGDFGDPVWVGPEVVGGPYPGVFDVPLARADTVVVRATRGFDKLAILYAFSSENLGAPLSARLYTGAQRFPTEPSGSPGFNLEVNGTTCRLAASFTIVDLALDPVDSHLVRLFATFSRTCAEGGVAMTGCVRYAEPSASDAGAAD